MQAILDDLLNRHTLNAAELEADASHSHLGFPASREGTDYHGFFDSALPYNDSFQLLGFNWNMQS